MSKSHSLYCEQPHTDLQICLRVIAKNGQIIIKKKTFCPRIVLGCPLLGPARPPPSLHGQIIYKLNTYNFRRVVRTWRCPLRGSRRAAPCESPPRPRWNLQRRAKSCYCNLVNFLPYVQLPVVIFTRWIIFSTLHLFSSDHYFKPFLLSFFYDNFIQFCCYSPAKYQGLAQYNKLN